MSGMLMRASTRRVRPAHEEYDAVARASAAVVIGAYSSSFGLASRLLAEPVRSHVRNVYALVRVADEIVDAPRPGADVHEREVTLTRLEEDTLDAMRTGHSSNLVVHAFADTARRCGIDAALVTPFFASMRVDLLPRQHDAASFADYIYGSAEVVGLMCLRAFLVHEDQREQRYAECAPGAQRLGAAFQKVNFLRDLAEDADDLGRRYLPGIDPRTLTDEQRDQVLADIRADLAAAAQIIPLLPSGSRVAVCAAHGLFSELAARLALTPAAVIRTQRVRVPTLVKARVAAGSVARRGVPLAQGRAS
jgi:phytoene synthase